MEIEVFTTHPSSFDGRGMEGTASAVFGQANPDGDAAGHRFGVRLIDLMGPRGLPDRLAILRSWASMIALAWASPSSSPSSLSGIRRFELRVQRAWVPWVER